MGNLNRIFTSKETDMVITYLSTKKNLDAEGFIGKFFETFKEEFTPMYLKILQQTEEKETISNSF